MVEDGFVAQTEGSTVEQRSSGFEAKSVQLYGLKAKTGFGLKTLLARRNLLSGVTLRHN